jgi:hypothetical protein
METWYRLEEEYACMRNDHAAAAEAHRMRWHCLNMALVAIQREGG